ncbi:MAG TPA: hypothetical protein VFQ36_23210 [Ktedonobacteraceae bacterium]|nr:hypothetical protein [Ktedonobacteraceae bacterium]
MCNHIMVRQAEPTLFAYPAGLVNNGDSVMQGDRKGRLYYERLVLNCRALVEATAGVALHDTAMQYYLPHGMILTLS